MDIARRAENITADVNFTDVRNWREDLGWKTVSHGLLCEILGEYCRSQQLPEAFLAAGKAFRVIQQKAGLIA